MTPRRCWARTALALGLAVLAVDAAVAVGVTVAVHARHAGAPEPAAVTLGLVATVVLGTGGAVLVHRHVDALDRRLRGHR